MTKYRIIKQINSIGDIELDSFYKVQSSIDPFDVWVDVPLGINDKIDTIENARLIKSALETPIVEVIQVIE